MERASARLAVGSVNETERWIGPRHRTATCRQSTGSAGECPVGEDANRTEWRTGRTESDKVLSAWKTVYASPGTHWMLYELAEMSRAVARSLRSRVAEAATARDAGRLLRMAAELERDAMRSLRLKAALAARRRRREFGLPSLRSACPPTPTRH